MISPILIPFRAEHLLTFVDRDNDILQTMKFAREKEQGGPAFTAIVNERIIGCAGIIILWPGVGSAWVALSKEIDGYGRWMTRTVKLVIKDTVRAFHLHRIEAVVLSDNKRNLEWIKSLGFTREDSFAYSYTQDKRDVVRFELLPGRGQ